MPVRSEAQWRYMQAVAHGWKPKRKKGPSVAVAKHMLSYGHSKGLPKRKSLATRGR